MKHLPPEKIGSCAAAQACGGAIEVVPAPNAPVIGQERRFADCFGLWVPSEGRARASRRFCLDKKCLAP